MKEQENTPEEELGEREANNLSDIAFRIMNIRILNSMKKDTKTSFKKGPAINKECIL